MADLKKIAQLLVIAGATTASIYLSAPWWRAPNAVLDPAEFVVEPAAVSGANTHGTAFERDPTLALPERSRTVPESSGNAFANLSWMPPPPVVVVAPPPRPPKPPPPTAPPLPFIFVGLMEQGAARPQAFLAKGDALLVVAAGDTIDNNTYRIETLSAQKIVITYLPMGLQQTLHILGTTP